MSHIEDLVQRYCPDGVQYKTLGEVGTFTRGSGLQKKDFTGTGFPCIHYGQIYTHYGAWATKTKSFIDPALAKRLHKAQPGDLIIATTSENDDDVCKAIAWLGDSEVAYGSHSLVFHHSLDPKYLTYWFQSQSFQQQKRRLITGVKVREVSAKSLLKVSLPIPPLSIQRDIARILDSYVKLASELARELAARIQQYNWYRDDFFRMLSLSEPSKTIGTIGRLQRGRRFTKADETSSGIPAIHYGEIYTEYGIATHDAKSRVRSDLESFLGFAHPKDVVIVGVGEDIEEVGQGVAWLGSTPVAIHDDLFSFTSPLNPEYVSHFLRTKLYRDQKRRMVSLGKMKRLSATSIGSIQIPVPLYSEQERVVKVLNTFSSLTSDISVGLPAEIAARQQQYEYYRDHLMSFKRLPL